MSFRSTTVVDIRIAAERLVVTACMVGAAKREAMGLVASKAEVEVMELVNMVAVVVMEEENMVVAMVVAMAEEDMKSLHRPINSSCIPTRIDRTDFRFSPKRSESESIWSDSIIRWSINTIDIFFDSGIHLFLDKPIKS